MAEDRVSGAKERCVVRENSIPGVPSSNNLLMWRTYLCCSPTPGVRIPIWERVFSLCRGEERSYAASR